MNHRIGLAGSLCLFVVGMVVALLEAQPGQNEKKPFDKKDFFKKDFGGFGKQRRQLIPLFDKDGDGRLNAPERQAAREAIKKAGGKGFGKGGFGGFKGPGGFMARPLVETTDTDKDSHLTPSELLAGVERFFADADKDKAGALTEKQLADALGRILPTPGGFPKFGPKEDKKGPPGGGFFLNPATLLAGNILKKADPKKTGKVSLAELKAAAEALFKELDQDQKGKLDEGAVAAAINQLLPPPNFGPGGFGKSREPARPGPKVSPAQVAAYPDRPLYDTTVLRTIFLEFENQKDWEAELADFYHTDVEVPATVTVDGKAYKNVGVHFRGNSSYMMTPAGYKHSLNLSFDFVDSKQRLYGYKTLNLLNAATDPSLMHSVLFCNLARQYMPAPKANFVKVVINGESWGVFANQQQFNKDFLKENFKTTEGTRWKVAGHPGASGAGLSYLGDNLQDYKRHYEIKSKDDPKAWKALIELTRVLNKTPADQLEEALKPILALDEVLWFLALDNVLVNEDGYWTRASDYSLYRDPKGKFHLIPHDTNETFMTGGGFGGKGGGFGKIEFGKKEPGKDFGGPGKGGGFSLDPLSGMNDARMPLRSKLLQVPRLRAQYLKNVHALAHDALDWKKLGPIVAQHRKLIEREVELDTRKLSSLADFRSATADTAEAGSRGGLRAFADGRRNFLLSHPEVRKVIP